MIFTNFCQRCEQIRSQSIKTLLLILLSLGTFSAYSDSDQPAGQVGQMPSEPRGVQNHPRYSDNGDGTVMDNRTGLIWMKNANCAGHGMSWRKAMRWAAELADGRCGIRDGSGKGDWRLPTTEEWHAMLDRRYRAQAGGNGRQWNEGPALSNAAGTGQWKEGDPFSNVKTEGMVLQKRYWSYTAEWGKWGSKAPYFVNIFSGRVAIIGESPRLGVWAVRATRTIN